jgi:imidazolonepropionase-like amidohydrolase
MKICDSSDGEQAKQFRILFLNKYYLLMKNKTLLFFAIILFYVNGWSQKTVVEPSLDKVILINNVQIFNGKDEKTTMGNVLVVNNLISKISTSAIVTNKNSNTTIIDGKGKFLMPGMIDAHWHSFMSANTMTELMSSETSYLFFRASNESNNTLLRGFTTVRDLGGPVFGLKKAIDQNLINGPRIYPSGAMISQTSGHGDFRMIYDMPRMSTTTIPRPEAMGVSVIADGTYEVTVATREQLRQGASQIKVMAGAGVSSLYDPLDVVQYSQEELKAAVDAAKDWGTYVAVHVYTSEGIKRAIEAGVKCIDHGHLMDEETIKLIADKGIWLSMQPFGEGQGATHSDPSQVSKGEQVSQGTDKVYKWAKKYNVKLAWGTDLLFNPKNTPQQLTRLTAMKKWFSNYEILKMVTHDNAQLCALSGARNPYPNKLGVIEEGAYADMLLIDGDVIKNIDLLGDPLKNLLLVVKDGVVYKNSLNEK